VTKIKVDLTELSMSGEQRAILAPYFASTKANAEGWLKMHCPIHGDASPSAGVNVITGWWVCHTCGERGTIARLIARQQEWKPPDYNRIVGEDSEWAPTGMVVKTPLPEESLPQSKDLEEYSNRLLTRYRDPLEYLATERGIEPKTIERFKIGYRPRENGGDYILPMWHDGALVNVRYYNPARNPKILNHTGYGSIGLFPDNDIPEHAKLVIVEGEWDCLATMQHLEKYGYTVRTFTNGTGAIRKLYSDNMAVKRILASEPAEVITIFDCDEPGRAAAAHLGRLFDTKDVLLPYPVTDDGGKDLTDYWQDRRGRPDEAERQLLDLVTDDTNGRSADPAGGASPRRPGKRQGTAVSTPVRAARRPRGRVQGRADLPVESLTAVHCPSLHSALTDAAYDGKLIALSNIEILSFLDDVLTIPKQGVVVKCKRDVTKVTPCATCPKNGEFGPSRWELSIANDEDAGLIDDLFGLTVGQCLPKIHSERNICKWAESKVQKNITYRPMVVRERGRNDVHLVFCAYERNLQVRPLGIYQMTARVSVSSKDRTKSLLVIAVEEPVKRAMMMPKSYVTPADGDASSLLTWLHNTADTLALKCTGIYQQTRLHVIMSMLFASFQRIRIGERGQIESGRLDTAIAGPTRTGKTTTVREVAKAFGHDGLDLEDSMVSGENTTKAGLTASSQQIGKKWYTQPGVFPRNHGGYVFLDEQQTLVRKDPGAMSALNTVRASGFVGVKMAAVGRFDAEARFATIMNPPESMKVRLVEAMILNYPEPETRARTDLVVTVPGVSRPKQQQAEEDLVGSDLPFMPQEQREWIAYVARTFPPENIVFPHGGRFVTLLDEYCDEYAELYNPDFDHIGVMHPQTNRQTLLKCAAAIANLTMSLDDAHEKVLVTAAHLECAKLFIDEVNEESGYAGLMRERKAKHEALQTAINSAVRLLFSTRGLTSVQQSTAKAFVGGWNDSALRIDPNNLRNDPVWGSIQEQIGEFVRQGLLVKDKGGASRLLVMHPEFRKALGEALRQREGET